MSRLDEYDVILFSIAVMIVPVVSGIYIGQSLSVGGAAIAAALIGVAMFVFPPSTQPTTMDEEDSPPAPKTLYNGKA
jgi:hypothetical protein